VAGEVVEIYNLRVVKDLHPLRQFRVRNAIVTIVVALVLGRGGEEVPSQKHQDGGGQGHESDH